MAKRVCKACGKVFESNRPHNYCPGPHYRKCEICGKEFECDPKSNRKTCSRECQKLLSEKNKHNVRTCEYCNEKFIAVNGTQKYCSGPHFAICEYCGQKFQFTCSPNERPKYCSTECKDKGHKLTVQNKYGVSNVSELGWVKDKISKSNSSAEVRQKRESTCFSKYGVSNVSQVEEFQNKQKETFKKHYGVDNPMKDSEIAKKVSDILSSDESIERHRQTLLERYGVELTIDIPGVRDKMRETCMEKYGVPYYVLSEEYRHPDKSNVISNINKNVASVLEDNSIHTEFEYVLSNKSYDLHIKDSNILIEIDPTYTHNVFGNHWNASGVSSDYHIMKTELAEQHGYRCIHIFDWDDLNKIVSMLNPNNKILGARCFKVKQISQHFISKFLNENHLQNTCKGQSICYALVDSDDNIFQVMTFGKPRYNKNYQWELLRLCTLHGVKIIGGANRLFSAFIRDYDPDSIISYCDRSKFHGDVYRRLKMQFLRYTPPAKIWSNQYMKITDNLLRQRGFDQLFNTSFGKGTSNEKLMLKHGWLPVYDCGQSVYEWRK